MTCRTLHRAAWTAFALSGLLVAVGIQSIPADAGGARSAVVKVIPTADPALSQAKVRPRAVEFLMSGDYMTRLRWGSWGRTRAHAVGVYSLNLCNSCAAGHVRRMPGRLILSRIVRCKGVRLYTAAEAQYLYRRRWRVARGLGQPTGPCS